MLGGPTTRSPVQAILDQADIGRATFYSHFRDKLDVVDAVAVEMFEGLHDADPVSASAGGVPVLALFRHAAERYRSLRAMLDTPGGEVFWVQSHAALCAAIESSQAAPRTRPRPSVAPAPIQAQFVAGALLGVLKWWLRAGMPHPPEQMAAWFADLLPTRVPGTSSGA
ncbi:MAG: TetR/AcrR family transcriptional regulator [Candidatus Limnocylindrales bacterium]